MPPFLRFLVVARPRLWNALPQLVSSPSLLLKRLSPLCDLRVPLHVFVQRVVLYKYDPSPVATWRHFDQSRNEFQHWGVTLCTLLKTCHSVFTSFGTNDANQTISRATMRNATLWTTYNTNNVAPPIHILSGGASFRRLGEGTDPARKGVSPAELVPD